MWVVALIWFLVCLQAAGTRIQWRRNFGTAVNSLVAKWRITGKKAQNVKIVLFQLWAALGGVFIEMWNFSWCTSLCPAKQQDEGGDGQFLSFERA